MESVNSKASLVVLNSILENLEISKIQNTNVPRYSILMYLLILEENESSFSSIEKAILSACSTVKKETLEKVLLKILFLGENTKTNLPQ